MERRISATELARRLGDILGRVRYRGDSFVIERNGDPVARLVPLPDKAIAALLEPSPRGAPPDYPARRSLRISNGSAPRTVRRTIRGPRYRGPGSEPTSRSSSRAAARRWPCGRRGRGPLRSRRVPGDGVRSRRDPESGTPPSDRRGRDGHPGNPFQELPSSRGTRGFKVGATLPRSRRASTFRGHRPPGPRPRATGRATRRSGRAPERSAARTPVRRPGPRGRPPRGPRRSGWRARHLRGHPGQRGPRPR